MQSIVFLTVVFVSCLMQGITGFGFALLATPLGLLFYDQKALVVILTIISFVLNTYLLVKIEAEFDRKLAKHLLISGLVGVPVGVAILTFIPSDVLKIIAAGMATVFGFILFRNQKEKTEIVSEKNLHNVKINSIMGFVTGLLQSSVGLSGPPLVLLLTRYELHPKAMRKTLALLFLSFSTFSLPIFMVKNVVSVKDVSTGLAAVPLVVFGGYLGNKVSEKVPKNVFRLVTLLLVLFSSLHVILNTLKII